MVISDDPQHTQCSNLPNERWGYGHNICLQSHGGYHHNGFVATHAFGHMMSYLLSYLL